MKARNMHGGGFFMVLLVAVLVIPGLIAGCHQSNVAGKDPSNVFYICMNKAMGSTGDQMSADVVRECRLTAERFTQQQQSSIKLGTADSPCPQPEEN